MISKENLTKCKELDEEFLEYYKSYKPTKKLLPIAALSMIGFLISISTVFSNFQYITIITTTLGIIILISIILTAYFVFKYKKNELNGFSLAVLSAYRTHELLEKHRIGAKLPSRIKEIKREMRDMKYHISVGWTRFSYYNEVIPMLAEPVATFIKNLDGMIFTLNEKELDIIKMKGALEEIIEFLLNEGPHDFVHINSTLKDYENVKKKTFSIKQVFENNKFVRYPVIFGGIVGAGGATSLITSIFGADSQTKIILWGMVSTALLIIYFTKSTQK